MAFTLTLTALACFTLLCVVEGTQLDWIHGCPENFDGITSLTLFPVMDNKAFVEYYANYLSMKCYARNAGYHVLLGDLDNGPDMGCPQEILFFRKHCLVLRKLQELPLGHWLVVLDGDTAAVNPTRCLEEFISPEADLMLYERFHNGEVMAGNYIIKHTRWSILFLEGWLAYEKSLPQGYSNYDNGALHMHLLRTLFPGKEEKHQECQRLWEASYSPEQYSLFVGCVKGVIGRYRKFPHIHIHHRGQGWALDAWVADNKIQPWIPMHHAVKHPESTHFSGRIHCAKPLSLINPLPVTELRARNSLLDIDAYFRLQFEEPSPITFDIQECLPQCPMEMIELHQQ